MSNERSPYEVAKAFEEQWDKKVKSISGVDRFFTTKVAGHPDSYLLVNSINALFSGKSTNPFEWIYHRVVDFVYNQHQSKGETKKKRIADMKDAISNARSSKAKLSIVTKLFSLADSPSRGEIHEVFMGFLILKLIIASNSTQLDQLASSGSFGFILHMLEICRGEIIVAVHRRKRLCPIVYCVCVCVCVCVCARVCACVCVCEQHLCDHVEEWESETHGAL